MNGGWWHWGLGELLVYVHFGRLRRTLASDPFCLMASLHALRPGWRTHPLAYQLAHKFPCHVIGGYTCACSVSAWFCQPREFGFASSRTNFAMLRPICVGFGFASSGIDFVVTWLGILRLGWSLEGYDLMSLNFVKSTFVHRIGPLGQPADFVSPAWGNLKSESSCFPIGFVSAWKI